jgi:hypothetical protein
MIKDTVPVNISSSEEKNVSNYNVCDHPGSLHLLYSLKSIDVFGIHVFGSLSFC